MLIDMTKVFIDGSAGTTGLRIHERLAARDDITLLTINDELRKDKSERAKLINEADITFLCLPDDAAREAVALAGDNTRIIDASTAHRTANGWTYGFPELSSAHKDRVAASKRVAVPGCHAGGVVSIVYPLIQKVIISPDYPLCCFSLTGYSGGGKSMIASYENADRQNALDAPRIYALTQQHKHLPEITAVCGLANAPVFTPIVGDFYSGMAVTVPLHTSLLKASITKNDLFELYREYYNGTKLIKVKTDEQASADGFIAANDYSGRDDMCIIVGGNDERITVTALFDNLGKGASGAAVQCMNLMLGCDETKGLIKDGHI